jgi:hypothetical protein
MQARTVLCVCTRVAVYLGYCMCVHAYMSARACRATRGTCGAPPRRRCAGAAEQIQLPQARERPKLRWQRRRPRAAEQIQLPQARERPKARGNPERCRGKLLLGYAAVVIRGDKVEESVCLLLPQAL